MATKVAGELYYDLDGQLIEIKRQLRQLNGYPFDPEKLKVVLQDAIEGKFDGGIVRKQSLFSVIATTRFGTVTGKKTKKCFIGSRYVYRDSDFDGWLPKNQPDVDACIITTLAPIKDWTFAEAAAAILDIGVGTDIALMGKLLIEHGHTITLPQVEEMVEKTERNEKTGIRIDGWGNFFFVENEDGTVSVGFVIRGERAWRADVFRLGRGPRWGADGRLLVRNLDASKLGS